MISCPKPKTALKALQKPKSALFTQAIPSNDPMVQTLLPPWGKICPMEVLKVSPPMGQKLPSSNTNTEYNDQRKNYSREYTRRFYEKACFSVDVRKLPLLAKPSSENPVTVKPMTEKPIPENPTQLNTKEVITKKLNTH